MLFDIDWLNLKPSKGAALRARQRNLGLDCARRTGWIAIRSYHSWPPSRFLEWFLFLDLDLFCDRFYIFSIPVEVSEQEDESSWKPGEEGEGHGCSSKGFFKTKKMRPQLPFWSCTIWNKGGWEVDFRHWGASSKPASTDDPVFQADAWYRPTDAGLQEIFKTFIIGNKITVHFHFHSDYKTCFWVAPSNHHFKTNTIDETTQ